MSRRRALTKPTHAEIGAALTACIVLGATSTSAQVEAERLPRAGHPVQESMVAAVETSLRSVLGSASSDRPRGRDTVTAQGAASGSPAPASAGTAAVRLGELDIPAAALRAYQHGESIMRQVAPTCRLPWTLLAGIGHVESNHGRHGGAVLGDDGVSTPRIRGVPLDGVGPVTRIPDTDGGVLDGDRTWDRAMGPMQFIPSTWRLVGVDGDGDGVRSPDDLDDAALAAGVYLCAGSNAIDRPENMRTALLRYNASTSYADAVRHYERAYKNAGSAAVSAPLASVRLAAYPVAEIGAADAGPGVSPRGRRGPTVAFRVSEPAGPRTSEGRRAPHEPAARPAPAGTRGPELSRDAGQPSKGQVKAPPRQDDEPAAAAPPPAGDPQPATTKEPLTTPDPEFTDAPEPQAEPEPAPEAGSESRTGLWQPCHGTYCVDDLAVTLDPGYEEQRAPADLDGDGDQESNADELAGLVGRYVTVIAHEQASGWTLVSVTAQ